MIIRCDIPHHSTYTFVLPTALSKLRGIPEPIKNVYMGQERHVLYILIQHDILFSCYGNYGLGQSSAEYIPIPLWWDWMSRVRYSIVFLWQTFQFHIKPCLFIQPFVIITVLNCFIGVVISCLSQTPHLVETGHIIHTTSEVTHQPTV